MLAPHRRLSCYPRAVTTRWLFKLTASGVVGPWGYRTYRVVPVC